MITLTLPYPISANRYWRTFMPKGFKAPVTTVSQEAKDYRRAVAQLAREAGITTPIVGRVHVDIELYPQRPQDWAKRARTNPHGWDDDVRCIDIDNARKCLYDAMKNIVFEDDKWVWSDTARRMEPDGEARVVVRITFAERRAPTAQPQLFEEPPMFNLRERNQLNAFDGLPGKPF